MINLLNGGSRTGRRTGRRKQSMGGGIGIYRTQQNVFFRDSDWRRRRDEDMERPYSHLIIYPEDVQ